MRSAVGRSLVDFYYRHSTAWASAIRDHDAARALIRFALWPVVFGIQHPGAVAALSLAGLGLVFFALRRPRDPTWPNGSQPPCLPAVQPTAPMARSATSTARVSSVVAIVSFQRFR